MGSNFTKVYLLAYRFSICFIRKTTIIRNKIISDSPNTTSNVSIGADIIFNGNMLEMFQPASEIEVKEITFKSPNNSCDLDKLITWPMKKYVYQLLPLITAIVNRLMDESVLLFCLERATITQLLKISGLDKDDMKNYHSISNLPFISKLIERAVARRIEEYLEHNDLNECYQSAYRRGY